MLNYYEKKKKEKIWHRLIREAVQMVDIKIKYWNAVTVPSLGDRVN